MIFLFQWKILWQSLYPLDIASERSLGRSWTSSSLPIEHPSARAQALHRLFQRGKFSQACEIKIAQGTKSKIPKSIRLIFRVHSAGYFLRSNFYFMHWQFWVSPLGEKFSVVQFSRLQGSSGWMLMDAWNSFLGIQRQTATENALTEQTENWQHFLLNFELL